MNTVRKLFSYAAIATLSLSLSGCCFFRALIISLVTGIPFEQIYGNSDGRLLRLELILLFYGGPFASGVRTPEGVSTPTDALVCFSGGSQVFVSDGTGPWGSVDLGRYAPSRGLVVNTGLVSGNLVLAGTNQGLLWVSQSDGTHGSFAGLSGNVVSLKANATGKILAATTNNSPTGPPPVFVCDPSTLACVTANAGMSTTSYSPTIVDFAFLPGTGGAGHLLAVSGAGDVFSSTDGGQTWTAARNGLPQFLVVYRAMAAGSNLFLATSTGLYRSVDSAGNWSKLTNGIPAAPVVGLDVSGSTLFAAVNAGLSSPVFKSADGGTTWQQPTGTAITAATTDALALTSTGLTASTIYDLAVTSAGIFLNTNAGTSRSTDGGATWSSFDAGKATASVLQIVPSGGMVYAGTFGAKSGVYRTSDAMSWNGGDATIANAVIRGIAPGTGNNVVAAGESGTFRSADSGATWTTSTTGLPGGAWLYGLVNLGGTIFGALSSGGVYKTTDNGASWQNSGSGIPSGAGGAFAITAAGSTLYVGVGPKVYRSSDGGLTWTAGGTIWPADTSYSIWNLSSIDGVLWASLYGYGNYQTYGVHKSTDGGMTWTWSSNGLPVNAYAYGVVSWQGALFAALQSGLYRSTDGGANWSPYGRELSGEPIYSLAATSDTLYVGTATRSVEILHATSSPTQRIVPFVGDVTTPTAHFLTDIALTNTGMTDANVTFTYTASLGSGSGMAADVLPAGRQWLIPDVMAYLRTKGLAIPASGQQGGTLLLSFTGLSRDEAVSVTARTTTATAAPQPAGRSGTAYPAMDPDDGAVLYPLTFFGHRSNGTDHSNQAIFNPTSTPVTVKVTAFSGNGDGRSFVVDAALTLPGYGWKQYNDILAMAGMDNGWVVVERVSATGAFSGYAAINNNATNDASYVAPAPGSEALEYINIPVVVKTSSFLSELVLSNSGTTSTTFILTYTESLAAPPDFDSVYTATVVLPPMTQQIITDVVGYLQLNGTRSALSGAALAVATRPSSEEPDPQAAHALSGGPYGGALHVVVSGALLGNTFAGARTASPSPAGGEFGLFTPGLFAGSEATNTANVYGLHVDANNRSNLAVINTGGSPAAGSVTLSMQVYDGDHGGVAAGAPIVVTLAPGQWFQKSAILALQGVSNGWVRITRTAGTAPWVAYGVVNDGGQAGQGTGDGAYIPMSR
ncbi:MAG: WD40/YVTN/BNR-like repeat-containing protein [Thermoanaerobaculia bacterium]